MDSLRPHVLLPLLCLMCSWVTAWVPIRASAQTSPSAAPASSASESAGSEASEHVSHWPQLLGAQYTFVLQHQTSLWSPYEGPHSLDPTGDTQPTHTIGLYTG